MRASFCSLSGSDDSFHILLRWKVIPSAVQDVPKPLPTDAGLAAGAGAAVVGELADRPMGERATEPALSIQRIRVS